MEKQRNSWNLKQLPLPFAGVALAFATLGNILVDIPWLKTSCGIISSIIFISILLKCILAMDQVKKDLTNPIVTASFATFPMAGMVLATYLIPLNSFFASLLWYVSLVGHLVLLTYWGIKFLTVARQKMVAVYFIPCVGFVVASITAPAFQNQLIGQILFYVGLIFYLVLLYPVMKANIQGDFPQMLQPLEMITAAPGSLCLAGYLTVFPKPNFILVVVLSILAFVSTLWGYKAFIKLDQRPFFPTFAAATFHCYFSFSNEKIKRLWNSTTMGNN